MINRTWIQNFQVHLPIEELLDMTRAHEGVLPLCTDNAFPAAQLLHEAMGGVPFSIAGTVTGIEMPPSDVESKICATILVWLVCEESAGADVPGVPEPWEGDAADEHAVRLMAAEAAIKQLLSVGGIFIHPSAGKRTYPVHP